MKKITHLFIFLVSIGLSAQSLTKSDFKKTEWFANNEQSNFYKADTISLLRILESPREDEDLNKTFVRLQINKQKDIKELKFKGSGRLKLENLNVENWTVTEFESKCKWKFDPDNQILNIYIGKDLFYSFKVVSREIDKIILDENNKGKEISLDLVTLTLVRQK